MLNNDLLIGACYKKDNCGTELRPRDAVLTNGQKIINLLYNVNWWLQLQIFWDLFPNMSIFMPLAFDIFNIHGII